MTTAERQPVAFTVSAPGTGYSANGTAQYGEVATFAFDASEYALSNTSDRTKAIIVRTDSHCELTVYAGDLMTGAGDSLLALSKQPDLGPNNYEYIVASYSTVPNALSLSAVAIIAQYDDTQLSISPSPHNMFGNALIQPNLELQEGETFLIESSNDLTGLLVASNKPLAVLFCDPFIEQVPPVFTWGRQFATAPLKGRQAYDVFRVVASEDSTEVMVTCSSSSTANPERVTNMYQLNERDFAEFNVSSNQYCFIQGSSNILVLQYSAGFHADNTAGDPTMITVPALTQYCNHYSLPTIGPSDGSINFTHQMNIFIPTPFYQLDQIFLNNQPLSSYNLNFTVIEQDGAPQVYASQVDLTEGVHTLYHTGPAATLGVVMYGFAPDTSYGHPGGLRLTQGAVCTGHTPHHTIHVCAQCLYIKHCSVSAQLSAACGRAMVSCPQISGLSSHMHPQLLPLTLHRQIPVTPTHRPTPNLHTLHTPAALSIFIAFFIIILVQSSFCMQTSMNVQLLSLLVMPMLPAPTHLGPSHVLATRGTAETE